jgi:hypothetical protein
LKFKDSRRNWQHGRKGEHICGSRLRAIPTKFTWLPMCHQRMVSRYIARQVVSTPENLSNEEVFHFDICQIHLVSGTALFYPSPSLATSTVISCWNRQGAPMICQNVCGGENFQSIPRLIISYVTSFEFRFTILSRSFFSTMTIIVPLSEKTVLKWPQSVINRRNAIKKN